MATPAPSQSGYSIRGFPVCLLSNQRAQMDIVLSPFATDKNPRGYQEKLFLNLTQYNPPPHIYLRHAIDGPDFRVIAHLITTHQWGQAIREAWLGKSTCNVTPHPSVPKAQYFQWTEFKGTDDISRKLTIQYDTTPGHQYPWIIRLDEQPGIRSKTGAVLPNSKASPDSKKSAQMSLSPLQIERWMYLGLEALQSLTTVKMQSNPAFHALSTLSTHSS